MEVLTIIISSSPYGDEKIWNALRLAEALCCSEVKVEVNIFLIGDAVNAAKRGQKPPKGFYNLEKMLADLVKVGVSVEVCNTSARAMLQRHVLRRKQEDGIFRRRLRGCSRRLKHGFGLRESCGVDFS